MFVAALQMVSTESLPANLAQAKRLLQHAADRGAELAVLPEYFCLIGAKDDDKLAIQERLGAGPIQDFIAAQAQALGLWIVAGTLPLTPDAPTPPGAQPRVLNSSLAFDPQGVCVARYDKVHLFRFDNGREAYDESRVLQAGTQPTQFALPSKDGHVWQVGMSVCYDLRFAELYRGYAATCCWCPAHSPTPPVRPTGKCCCARAPLKTSALWRPQHKVACTPADGAPGASLWWSIPGAWCWLSKHRNPAW
jgi:deaminated glutathione amidase